MNRRYVLISLVVMFSFVISQYVALASRAQSQPNNKQLSPNRARLEELRRTGQDFFQGAERERIKRSQDRLTSIQARHNDQIMSLPNVTGFAIGLDEDTLELIYVVKTVKGKPASSLIPNTIEGTPVRIEESDPLVPMNGGQGCIPCHKNQQGAPIAMGNSFGDQFRHQVDALTFQCAGSCTMGFKAYKRDNGDPVFVTNAHCQPDANLCDGAAGPGTINYHPSLQDQNDGACLPFLNWNVGTTREVVLSGSSGANIDAAIVNSDNMTTTPAFRDIANEATIPADPPAIGDIVQKSGRSSGHTFGRVFGINESRVINYNCVVGDLPFTGLISFEAVTDPLCENPVDVGGSPYCGFVFPGDSGSAVVTRDNPARVVALLFSGVAGGSSGSAFPIQRVLHQFALTLDPNATGPCTSFSCTGDIHVSLAPGPECDHVVEYSLARGSGGCGTPFCTPPSGSAFPVGTTRVFCTPEGLDEPSCHFDISVREHDPPTISTTNVVTHTDPDLCTAAVMFTPSVSDHCDPNPTTACTPASGSTFQKGVTTVNCTATDSSGNNASSSFTVTVTDAQAPTLSCSANLTKVTDAGHCYATTNYTVSASDNCDGSLTPTCTPASGSNFQKGTTTVSCNVHDAANNSSTCSFTVTVNDTQAPSVTCPGNLTRNTDTDSCAALVPFTASANDICDGALTPSCTPAPGSSFQKGTTTVNCTGTDSSNNSASCSFTVTVKDTQAPTMTCSPLIRGTDPDACSAVVNFNPTAVDNCDTGLTPTCTPASGSTFQKGVTTVSCTVKDSSNNSSNCSFNVTVNDTQSPSITCSDLVKPTDPNVCTATVTFSTPTVSDNCPGVGVPSCTPPSGSAFPKGDTLVFCSVVDAANNPSGCFFVVSVVDMQPPSITCSQNLTVPTGPNLCSATVSYGAPAVSDNCPFLGTPVCSPPSGTTFPKGTTTIACSVSDNSKNQAHCSFSVTVIDTQPPALGCPASFNAVAVASCPFPTSRVVTYSMPAASDNCPGVTASCNPASGSVLPAGTTTITCTAIDASGNTTNCSFRVNVFSFCLQDDSQPGNFVLINAMTGEYAFYCNGALVATGTGGLIARGCSASIDHNKGDRRVHIQWDTTGQSGRGAGTAIVQLGPNATKCQITDQDMSNNSCGAQPAGFDGK